MNTAHALQQTLFQQRSKPREGETLTHFGDITGCLRATAYRRRGLKQAPLTREELAKFAIGLGYEAEVGNTLAEAGHVVEQGVEVSGFGLDVGHPDHIVDGALVIETKTTSGGARYPKSDPRAGEYRPVSAHHALQAAAYALALEMPKAVVLVNHLGFTHEEVAHEVNPEQYREKIEELARDVVALTGPEMPLPPAEPPPRDVVPYDACSYCRWYQCSRNPKHDPALLEEELV